MSPFDPVRVDELETFLVAFRVGVAFAEAHQRGEGWRVDIRRPLDVHHNPEAWSYGRGRGIDFVTGCVPPRFDPTTDNYIFRRRIGVVLVAVGSAYGGERSA